MESAIRAEAISVIIPTYNRASTICRAVDSVLEQTVGGFEVIVVDDGSTDNTATLLEEYAGRIKYLTQPNQGVSRARNRGILAAAGSWLAFLDSDDAWQPEKLARQMGYLEEHPKVRFLQTDEIWIRDGERIYPKSYHKKVSGWIFPQMLVRCLVSPSATMLHRSILDRVGLFDESLPACEDYDLWLRIGSQYEIHNLEEELVTKYGGHEDQLSQSIWGLDRFRIQSLLKIRDEVVLADDWRRELSEELVKKCEIFIKGLKKRHKEDDIRYYQEIIAATKRELAQA